jgi:hypothetical protein
MINEIEWLLFTAQLPAKPSSLRVGVWRKLNDSGAVNLQSGIWILPFNEENRIFLERLLAHIKHKEATGQIFFVQGLNQEIQADILGRFKTNRNREYDELLEQCEKFLTEIDKESNLQKFTFAELEENEQNLQRLRKWFAKIQKRDFFKTGKSEEANTIVQICRKTLQTYTHQVLTKEGIDMNLEEAILPDEPNQT